MFGHTHQLSKPLNGLNGYRRLARLVVRAFYAGECPPKEPEEEGAPQPIRRREGKVSRRAGRAAPAARERPRVHEPTATWPSAAPAPPAGRHAGMHVQPAAAL